MIITTSTVILPFHWHTLAFPQLFHSHSKDHLKLRLHTSERILVSESLSWRMFFKRSWLMALKPSWYSPTFRGTITNLDIGWRCLYQSSPWLSIYIREIYRAEYLILQLGKGGRGKEEGSREGGRGSWQPNLSNSEQKYLRKQHSSLHVSSFPQFPKNHSSSRSVWPWPISPEHCLYVLRVASHHLLWQPREHLLPVCHPILIHALLHNSAQFILIDIVQSSTNERKAPGPWQIFIGPWGVVGFTFCSCWRIGVGLWTAEPKSRKKRCRPPHGIVACSPQNMHHRGRYSILLNTVTAHLYARRLFLYPLTRYHKNLHRHPAKMGITGSHIHVIWGTPSWGGSPRKTQLLLPVASASAAVPRLRTLQLLLPGFSCRSSIASASTAAPRLRPLQHG